MTSISSRQTVRVEVSPALLRWACRRAGVESGAVAKRFPRFAEWERGETQPTLRQVEEFARFTRTAVGYLFLREPPEETVPIPDFRTVADRRLRRPSPDLLDTIFLCQERQYWYREYAAASGEAACRLVGMLRRTDGPVAAAAQLREALRFDLEERAECPTWTEALRSFRDRCEAAGALVMTSGIVGNSTRRKLDPTEFSGFALSDPLAPLVFVNGADAKAAQLFTLAHEMAHVALDETALSDSPLEQEPDHEVERWCSRVAAEFLVPLDEVRENYDARIGLRETLRRLAAIQGERARRAAPAPGRGPGVRFDLPGTVGGRNRTRARFHRRRRFLRHPGLARRTPIRARSRREHPGGPIHLCGGVSAARHSPGGDLPKDGGRAARPRQENGGRRVRTAVR